MIIILILYLIILISILVLIINFNRVPLSLCKKVYNKLPYMTFYKSGDIIFGIFGNNIEFAWFTQDNTFDLDFNSKSKHFLFDMFIVKVSPIHYYWIVKYERWCKKNIDLNVIPDFSKFLKHRV